MITVNALSEVAALMGDPARASMLQLLMDGRAHTASDLALTAGVTAQTASGHLVAHGRGQPAGRPRPGPQPLLSPGLGRGGACHRIADGAGRRARRARRQDGGVAARSRSPLLPHLLRPSRGPGRHRRHRFAHPARPSRAQGPEGLDAHAPGELFCQRLGVDLAGARAAHSRHFARQCLDWSERRPHISGALGSAIADTFFKKGWAERLRRGRTVRLTDSGRRALSSHFGTSI